MTPEERFQDAFHRTMKHEGGYVNDPADPGGETYRGISYRTWPNWEGWEAVNAWRAAPQEARAQLKLMTLDPLVEAFYFQHYWNLMWLDVSGPTELTRVLFDSAVNMGLRPTTRFLQRALNALNQGGACWPDIIVDDMMGTETNSALTLALKRDSVRNLVQLINIQRGYRYLELMENNPRLERFARGWLCRLQ